MNNWEKGNSFLEQFPPKRRSLIANIFCNIVREGTTNPDDLIIAVSDNIYHRLYESHPPDDEVEDSLRNLSSALRTSEAYDYAGFIIDRESLSFEEKQVLKKGGTDYAREAMKAQPATEKQLNYIKILGWTGEMPTTKFEAGEMIGKLKTGESVEPPTRRSLIESTKLSRLPSLPKKTLTVDFPLEDVPFPTRQTEIKESDLLTRIKELELENQKLKNELESWR